MQGTHIFVLLVKLALLSLSVAFIQISIRDKCFAVELKTHKTTRISGL
jgi:hypothetical protein